MNTKNSTEIRKGRYVGGGQTEVNNKAIEWWERAKFSHDVSDSQFVIDAVFENRIDKIAYATLGDSSLAWLILQYNSILDPLTEIIPGRILRIPTKTRVQTMLGSKVGGYPSTREVPLNNISPII